MIYGGLNEVWCFGWFSIECKSSQWNQLKAFMRMAEAVLEWGARYGGDYDEL